MFSYAYSQRYPHLGIEWHQVALDYLLRGLPRSLVSFERPVIFERLIQHPASLQVGGVQVQIGIFLLFSSALGVVHLPSSWGREILPCWQLWRSA